MEETHQCQQCSYEFELKFQLEHHVQRDHTNAYAAELFHAIVEPEQLSCICCEFKGYHKRDLYEHCKHKHHGRIDGAIESASFCNEASHKFSCNVCHFKTDSSLVLVIHTDSHRRAAELTTPPQASAVDLVVNQVRLEARMLKHAAAEDVYRFKCAECSFGTNYKPDLKKHIKVKHTAAEDIEWIYCANCSYKGDKKSNFLIHMRRVHPNIAIGEQGNDRLFESMKLKLNKILGSPAIRNSGDQGSDRLFESMKLKLNKILGSPAIRNS